ncbi:serpin-ZXA-like [Papaver somniferum]|uniref:serpin-ZXA-like n=1 Tax=Papaver somniferum TaxID=3469 RepID=UPI000E703658|nr:serpin-ZXA-like [Papaver somniferum]
MYIILPEQRNGLVKLIAKVSSNPASFLRKHVPSSPSLVSTGEFKVPKFKILFDIEASRVLKKQHMVFPFNKRNAELTDMAHIDGTSKDDKLHEVDEEGPKAAASTAVLGRLACRTSTSSSSCRFCGRSSFIVHYKTGEKWYGIVHGTLGHVLHSMLNSCDEDTCDYLRIVSFSSYEHPKFSSMA